MRLQETVDAFANALALGHAESAIYVHLCVAGPAKAGDLASALKLHRNEVYRNASRLIQRGLVRMTMERPARFAAVEPKEVFEGEIASRAAAIEELRRARDALGPLLLHLQPEITQPPRSTYKVIQGRHEIHVARNRLLSEARESVDWAATAPAALALADLSGALDEAARSVRDAGVALRAVFRPAAESAWQRLDPLLRLERAQAREAQIEGVVQLLVVDGEELLMWVVNDPSESLHAREEVAIQTTASGFVQAERLFFEQTWSDARALRRAATR